MERDWRTNFTGALLDFQEFIAGKWGDESKIADYLLETAVRLGGVERGILRKNRDSDCLVLAHRCLNCPSCQPDLLYDEFITHLQKKKLIPSDLDNSLGTLSKPVMLEPHSLLIRNYMIVKSAASGYMGLELILINLSDSCLNRDFLRAMESFLNIFNREEYIEHLNHTIKNKEREINRIMDSKTQFLGSLSHEVRSPLNGIVCMGSLLRETELNEDQLDLLNIIQFSADNITRIIQDLVDITMLSSGKVVLKNETFSLITFSRNLVKNIREEALSKGLTLHLEIDKKLDLFHGDQVRLGQILSNLLQNAIKYTREGDISLDIQSSEEGIEFIVSDTGIGIAKDKQDVIFEEFFQLDRNTLRKGEYKGVGLGLAIVKDLVTMMGGTITVRSQEGKGSSFKFLLPQLPGDNVAIHRESLDLLASPQELRFLVVDDDEINRLFLRTILERQGGLIDEAENGLVAVELAGKNIYDMILMDISMPFMNGLDATREIRKNKRNLPILAVTANAFEEDFKRILEAGLDDIILKPVYEDQLMDKVSTWLDRRRKDKYAN